MKNVWKLAGSVTVCLALLGAALTAAGVAFAAVDSWYWATKAPIPTARTSLRAAGINGLLYVVGGHNGVRDVPTFDRYDPGANVWASLPPLPHIDGGNDGLRRGRL